MQLKNFIIYWIMKIKSLQDLSEFVLIRHWVWFSFIIFIQIMLNFNFNFKLYFYLNLMKSRYKMININDGKMNTNYISSFRFFSMQSTIRIIAKMISLLSLYKMKPRWLHFYPFINWVSCGTTLQLPFSTLRFLARTDDGCVFRYLWLPVYYTRASKLLLSLYIQH